MIAAGVEPGTVAQFKLIKNGAEVAVYQTRWANDNCVINQEYWPIGVAARHLPGAGRLPRTLEHRWVGDPGQPAARPDRPTPSPERRRRWRRWR